MLYRFSESKHTFVRKGPTKVKQFPLFIVVNRYTSSAGGRTITILRFADDIDGLAGQEEELAKLDERFDKASTAYGMEISADKTKLMTNNTSGINTETKVNGQQFEKATSFKYLISVITDKSSMPEILSRKAQTTAALTRLKPCLLYTSPSPRDILVSRMPSSA